MIRIERVSSTMVLYNDEEQGTGGYCDLFKHEIAKLEFKLGIPKKKCKSVYERLLSYQVLLYDPKSQKLLRERPISLPKGMHYPKTRGSDESKQVEAIDKKINQIFEDQTGLGKKSVAGIHGWDEA